MRRCERRDPSARAQRGAVLIEIVISIALFAGAAAFALAAASSAVHSADRSGRLARCADLARSKMAELEAGLITLGDLRGNSLDENGDDSVSTRDRGETQGAAPAGSWTFAVKTTRSEFAGLTLVELTVREAVGESTATETAATFTLRQLVRMNGGESADRQPVSAPDSSGSGVSGGGPTHFLAPNRDAARPGGQR